MRRKKHYEKRVVKSGKEEQKEKPEKEEKGEHRGTEARRKE